MLSSAVRMSCIFRVLFSSARVFPGSSVLLAEVLAIGMQEFLTQITKLFADLDRRDHKGASASSAADSALAASEPLSCLSP